MTHGHRIVLALLAALALGGCGGGGDEPQVASAGGGRPSSAPAADEAGLRRQFAQCMRAAGVDVPDPGADGMIAVPAQKAGEGETPQSRKMQAAMEKCHKLLPNGGEPPKVTPEDLAKLRDMAKCMRANGVPDFPDPDPATGGLQLERGTDGDGAALRKAMEKCRGLGPDSVGAVTKVTG
ncbi:hypothetical protein AB0J80_21100 [Actinoplanes sp. NPDC049548]|uniref:hypothetical protein n=1 Tax=Actinoplanes sp. NPDC049548 TaxID=3155152 RepID=UPI003416276C